MPKPYTVMYVNGQSEIGGGEKSLLELVRNLDLERYSPLVVLPAEGTLSVSLRECGVGCLTGFSLPPLLKGKFLGWPRAVSRMVKIARREKVDIIHGNGTRENIASGVAARLLGIPSVWHIRNLVVPGMRDLERPLSFLPTRIIANSRAVARRVKDIPWARKRLEVVYNGVDLRLFNGNGGEVVRRDLGVGQDEILVGIVGRIGTGKGHELFVRAAKRALEGREDLRFVIVGDELFTENGRRRRLAELVRELGLNDRVTLTGYRRDVERVIQALDILVLASEREPFGRVLIEAMAAGKPVVATAGGGVREVVEAGVSALLVEPGDVRLMASAIKRLSADRDLRERMGRSGRERVLRKFTIERHVSRIQRIYDDILGEGGRR